MKVAAVQFDIVWEDKPANHAIIERMLEDAKFEPGTFVLLPELGDTGFSMRLNRIVDDQTLPWARKIATQHQIYVQVGYATRGEDRKGRNCTTIIGPDGEPVATYIKVHPFTFGKESEHYVSGNELVVVNCGGTSVCPLICYDLRFPELWRLGALQGVEIFTIGANWPNARQHHWRTLAIARAIENQAYVVAANRIGSDPFIQYAGGSIIVSPKGDILAEATDQPSVLTADLDLESLCAWRKEFPSLSDARRQLLGTITIHKAVEHRNSGVA